MSHLNTSFDPDIDSFLNLDQAEYTPATTSPNIQRRSLAQQSSSASTSHFASTPQTFAGPSFQYDAYRQQTGLPVGGLANTFAVNQNSGLQHWDGHSSFVMPDETINLPLSKIEDFDFNRGFDFNDMDLEDESPADLPTMFYPNGSSSQSQFVSPTTLVSSNTSPSTSTPVQRMYPGMHSQAAQAKAQQAQQKQQEMIRKQQQARQIPGQKPLPKTQLAKDPQVEESISRILNQMRQKSVSSADDDSNSMPSISNMPRIKKDEDDMDEDERLLASEEGKKLSSKERRQLRNKVSARAFRSRRKGKHFTHHSRPRVLTGIRIHWSTRRRGYCQGR
jgi:bZIP-type transcription factor MBZ1